MELWVSDIDGRNQRKLASVALLTTGAWSPDGSHVSFTDHTAGDHKIFTVGVDGMQLREISTFKEFVGWLVWPPEGFHYASAQGLDIWKVSADSAPAEKILEGCAMATDYLPGGKFLLGVRPVEPRGIYVVSLLEKRCIPLVPGILTLTVRSAVDGRSILYAVSGELETAVYRVSWNDGEAGNPEVAVRLPFVFHGPASDDSYDFSRDLSTFVYSRPSGQADLFHLGVP